MTKYYIFYFNINIKILAPLFKYIKFDKSVSLYLPGQANY